MVRISKVKGAFDKGYIQKWSEEHLLVQSHRSIPLRVFKLIDKGGEELKFSWYPEEVQEIAKNRFLIEKIIRKLTTDKGEQEVLVKGKGWRVKFNKLITATDVEGVK